MKIAWKNEKEKSKKLRKLFLDLNFGEGGCLKSDFTRPNSKNKSKLLKISQSLEVAIFNNDLA